MSTTPSPGEPPKPPEVPISTNLQVSSYYAQLEWFRAKVQQMPDSGDTLWVLAIENGSPEYDAKIARLLRSRRPNLRYVVVSGARIYAKMMQKNPDLADCVVVVQQAFETWDGSLPQLPEGWEKPTARATAPAAAASGTASGGGGSASGSRAGDASGSADESEAGVLAWFDLVHSSIWRLSRCFRPKGGDDGAEDEGGTEPKAAPAEGAEAGDATAKKEEEPAAPSALGVTAQPWLAGPLRKPQELDSAKLLLRFTRPRGTMLLFRHAASGVFDLRARLHAVLYERNGHRVHPSELEPGGGPLAGSISREGKAVTWVERIDSQVDITDSVGEELSVDAARALGLVLGVDVQQLAQQDAELMEHVVEELCDHSLGGDGFDSGPVLVHTPLHAISCVRLVPEDTAVQAAKAVEEAAQAGGAPAGSSDSESSPAATPAKYYRDDLVKFWGEHGDELSPLLPVLPPALAQPAIEPLGGRRRVRQLMLAALAGIERGMPVMAAVTDADSEDDAELGQAGGGGGAGAGSGSPPRKGGVFDGGDAGDWTMAKAAALAKGVAGEEDGDEEAFYRTMRGTWGSFTGTGQASLVELASQQANDGYEFGGGPVAVMTAPGAPKGIAPASPEAAKGDGEGKAPPKVPPALRIASLELAQQAIGAVRDPWYPHGTKGGFFNAGLLNWHATRSAWLIRPLTTEPDAPPLSDDDIDEIVEELAKLQRTYTLPRPMRLGDIIDLYCEIWDTM